MSDTELLTHGRLERLLGGDARQRDGVRRLARSLRLDPRRYHRDRDLAVAIVQEARLQRRVAEVAQAAAQRGAA